MRTPGLADQSPDDDDRVGERDEGVIDSGSAFGTDQEFFEPAGVPGVGAFHDPSGAGLYGLAFGADLPVIAQFSQQVPGFVGVISSIQMHHDLIW